MQVPLGVFLKNENKLDEMADILDHLHKYVPRVRKLRFQDTKIIHTDHFSHILLGVTNSQLPGFVGATE